MEKMKGNKGFANMPENVVMKEWPKAKNYRETEVDDTIKGIDEVVGHSEGQIKKHISKQK
jgi:hypothetical protein